MQLDSTIAWYEVREIGHYFSKVRYNLTTRDNLLTAELVLMEACRNSLEISTPINVAVANVVVCELTVG